jgi:hypothetical protein
MYKAIAGFLFWLVLLGGACYWLSSGGEADSQRVVSLWKFASGTRRTIRLQLSETDLLRVGDLIFLEGQPSSPAIGRITRVENPTSREQDLVWTDYAEAELYSSAPALGAAARLTLHQNPQSIAWVVETMLSPQIRAEIIGLLTVALREHQAELVEKLQPLLLESIRRSSEVVRNDFRQAIEVHAPELEAISRRYQEDFLETRLTPLLRTEVWPIVQREVRPLANRIGQQLWDQASLWRLTWRLVYDASPLPQRDLTRKEFERFVAEHVAPTINAHLPDFIEVQKRIFSDILNNPTIRNEVQDGLAQLAADEELQHLLLEILNEVVTDNPRLKAAWQDVWSSPQAQAALTEANDRLEPTITAIGEAMFGNPRKQITPEFSRVLRNKVLFKDQRWLVLHPATDPLSGGASPPANLPVEAGDPNAPNPFHVPARSRQ